MAKQKYPLVNKASAYARSVVKGKIDACLYVRQACQRHLDDLVKSKQANYPYKFCKDTAESWCEFAEMMPHVKGKWVGMLIILEPWQCFFFVQFGWVKKSDGLRRYREIYAEIPRKNSKSTMGAVTGLKLAFADNEPAAEVFSVANSENQANTVFTPAWKMCKNLPAFENTFDIQRGGTEKNTGPLYSLESGSTFKREIGKPSDGASPNGWIQDEFHEAQTSVGYDAGSTGMGARSQPVLETITTGGVNTQYPCYELRKQAIEILKGAVENDQFFTIIYTIDKDDDWTDFKNWIKANPNYGVSVSMEYLKGQYKKAMQTARKQNILKCKHLNMWCNAGSAWLDGPAWEKCGDPTLNINDFLNEPCYPGLDIASKIDIASKMRLFRRGGDYYLFSKHYTNKENIEGADKSHYAGWAHDGFLTVHPGARNDIQDIENELKEDAKLFNISGEENGGGEVCADPWNAQQLLTNLMTEGIAVVEIPQTAPSLSEPMKEIEALVKSGNFHHDGNPVTTWMFENVVCEPDHKDNIFPRKENKNSPNKIDGAVATINAMARAMVEVVPVKSFWES